MCLPLAALPIAAAAVSAAGAIMGGLQANAMGKYQQEVAEQNADIARDSAKDSIERGHEESLALGRRIGAVKGQQTAAAAANGVDVGYGSAAQMAEDTAMLGREDQQALFRNVNERTKGFAIQAHNFVTEGKAARYRGKQQLIGSFFDAGSSLISGFQQSGAIKAKLGVTGGG
jgi:hypothetical protein